MEFTGTGAILRILNLDHDLTPYDVNYLQNHPSIERESIYDRPLKFALVCPREDRVVVVLIELAERRAFQ
jgi:hypothetical protein